MRLVYWCPSPRRAPGRNEPLSPKFIIPWYAYNSVTSVTNPQTGAVSEVRSKQQLIPATDDPRFVPTVHLRAWGRETVEAAVEVSGGRRPIRMCGQGQILMPPTTSGVRPYATYRFQGERRRRWVQYPRRT